MDTYLYENLYHSSVRFFQHYAQNVNPRSQVRNRFQNIQLLQELADIYSLLLRFSCCKNFFSLSPQHYTKIHRLQLYLVYQQGFMEEHFQEPEKAPTETQKIKNFIEQNIKNNTLHVDDYQYHPYEQVIHQGKTALHIFGLFQKTYSGSYCFFLFDCRLEKKKHSKQQAIKLRETEKYCHEKYKDFLAYASDKNNKGTLEAFCKENKISYKAIHYNFKKYYGCSFKRFLLQQQLLTALFLIIYSSKSLKEIAHEVHFQDYSNFRKALKNGGIIPSKIKRLHF